MARKILLIIIDGLGDRPTPKFENKTPLQAAKIPNLNLLTKNGICGLVTPYLLPWQKEPDSDTSHLAIFGYDPKIYYLGRGPYEAAGIGMKMKEDDIALRVNLGTVDERLKVIDRRAGRIEKINSLANSISGIVIKNVKFILKSSLSHRAVLILRGKNLSDKISDSDPQRIGKRILKVKPFSCDGKLSQEELKKAKFTAEILNKFLERSYQILKNHPLNKGREKGGFLPANYLLLRGAGKFKRHPSFYQRYKLRGVCIAGGGLYKGVAEILGMNLIKVKGATGTPGTNIKGKFLAAKNALKKYDFVFCHIKGADILGHDGNFNGKKEFLEKVDKNLKILLPLKNTILVVTGDHSTPCFLMRHSEDPIPILISGGGITSGSTNKFCEKNCKKGKIGTIKQIDIMKKILKLRH